MKINYTGGVEHYQSYVQKRGVSEPAPGKPQPGKSALAGKADGKTDMVTISGDAAARAGAFRAVPAMAAEVAAPAPAGRLGALQEAVRAGTYQVAAGDVADAILGLDAQA